MKRSRIVSVCLASVAIICFGIAVWALASVVQRLDADAPLDVVPTSERASQTPTPTVPTSDSADDATATSRASRTLTATDSSKPEAPAVETSAPEQTQPLSFADPVGLPHDLTIKCTGREKPVASSKSLVASTAAVGSKWSPVRGTVEWWSPHPLPGHDSPYAAVIGAHVTYNDEPDVFRNLDEVVPGCEVIIGYDSGDIVTFEATEAPTGMDKTEFPTAPQYDHYWEPTEPGVWLTVITCDREAEHRPNGESTKNLVFSAKRTS